MTREPAANVDVSTLPSAAFGHRAITWWGTLGFMAAEGLTLVVCVVAYIYVQRNFPRWPPPGTPRPSITIPLIQMAVMLVSIPMMAWTSRAARRLDLRGVRLGMVLSVFLAMAFCVLRWFEFQALNTRWDSTAYGSAAWAVFVAHTTLLVTQVFESSTLVAILYRGPVEPKHFGDVDDSCLYWYFLTGGWILLSLLVFFSSRLHP
jgi:heme/copper-type cytochrome/quinol oxidase subunit 3